MRPALLVLTHGRLAEELVAAVTTILGKQDDLRAMSIGWKQPVPAIEGELERILAELSTDQGVVILTDMFGGTPTNQALAIHEPHRVEIVTGVNLPMLIRWTQLDRSTGLHDAALAIADQGRNAIQVATAVLDRPAATGESESPA